MSANTTAEPLLPIARAAREVGLSKAIVGRLVERRLIPSVQVGDRVKIRVSDLRRAVVEVPAAV